MKKFIGDRKFYKSVLMIVIPIMIQNGITNFVNLLDNLMIGRTGATQMTGVAIANQLFFVFNLVIFGAVSGAGIFTAQYHGTKDAKGVQYTFRFKMLVCVLLGILGILAFLLFGEALIQTYLTGEGTAEDIAASLAYGREYMLIMLIGIIPFTVVQAYASTMRETEETVWPMRAGVAAVLINLVLNYILIFGHFGAPKMGVAGAAIATVVSRYAEMLIVVIRTHRHKEIYYYMDGLYKSLGLPGILMKKIIITGLPLMINETLWAAGMAMINQCYSVRGLDVVAAVNIYSTIWNVFSVAFISMGSAVGIMVGQILGRGDVEEAKDTDRKLIAFSVVSSLVIGFIMAAFSKVFPNFYVVSQNVKDLATGFILVGVFIMPWDAFTNAAYFTIRAGGKTVITFIFDSVFVWVVNIPLAYVLSRYSSLSIIAMFFWCQSALILKCVIGFVMIKKGIWIQNLVVDMKED